MRCAIRSRKLQANAESVVGPAPVLAQHKAASRGGTRTKQARQEIARREEQIVALRLRHHSFAAIGRVVGVSKQAAQRTYYCS
jgi:hypothetical protein